jgi:hypothetical protein
MAVNGDNYSCGDRRIVFLVVSGKPDAHHTFHSSVDDRELCVDFRHHVPRAILLMCLADVHHPHRP